MATINTRMIMDDAHAHTNAPVKHTALPPPDRAHSHRHPSIEVELRWLSFLSHDLCNNLNAISLQLGSLKGRLEGLAEFTEEFKEVVCAQRSIAHTTEGMRQLLTYSKLRADRPHVERRPVNLHELANSTAMLYLHLAQSRGLELVVDVPTGSVVSSNYDLIVIVLQNLLCNSIKFSAHGRVWVRSHRMMAEHQWVLSVIDEGPGIAPTQLQHIFAAFSRCDTLNQDGVGLGLYIAWEAAEILGAMLSVESQLGAGSTFSLTLPRDSIAGVGTLS